MDTILPARALSYGEIFINSFKLYKASFVRVIMLSLVIAFITFVPRFTAIAIGHDIFRTPTIFSPIKLFLILIDLIGLIFFVGILWRMHCVNEGKNEPLKEDLGMGASKVISAFIAGIVQIVWVFAVIAFIFLMHVLLHKYELLFLKTTPGILFTILIFFLEFLIIMYCSMLFVFMLPIIAVENKGVIRALEGSVQLVWDHWWKVFTVQITPWISYLFLLSILRYLLHIDLHIYFLPVGGLSLTATSINLILFIFFIPWITAVLIVQLQDLEYRKKLLSVEK